MKKFSFVLLLSVAGIGHLCAQNTSSSSNKTGIYTSPPGVFFDGKNSGHIDLNRLKAGNAAAGLSLINGSFELNSGYCIINGSNTDITANVVATTAYGCGKEIDLMNNGCGYGTALSGNYFLCLSNGTGTCGDECTLQLNGNLVTGTTYMISYFDRGYDVNGCCPPGVVLEVGVSTNSTSQGIIVYTSPVPTTNVWSERTFTFVAPNNGAYISFHAKDNAGRWTHIDSVTISTNVCPAPYNLKVPNVTSNAAELTWKLPQGTVSFFKIFGREKGTETGLRKRKESTDTRVVITDLLPNTTYEWAMRSICDTGKSVIVSGPDFTTLPSDNIADNIKILPNPVRNNMEIDGLSVTQKTKLTIVDFLGNVRLTATITGKSYKWNIATLQSGNYLLKIETNNTVVSRWFMKE